MTIDQTNASRVAILARLKADTGLTAHVPASRIYPSRTPATLTWPFVKLGVISDLPYRPSGAIGSQSLFGTIHIFTKGIDAENQCHQIRGHIVSAIDAMAGIPLTSGMMHIRYDGGTVMQDGGEADAYHGVVNWEAVALTE